ncbi:DUF1876 domain-containing protein [Crossiella sp. CA-258035]|uniref:DUF1876 domain-containing protein n=1 Tax=Crossiella sp. CA-258035 TaxID=2981138 RepID=UPI0024BD37C6|nr:DUF1876 domain-containing protein [Crossiella sp. CA-258035]WHT22899.1 DUF1876 domain-containing protein [Crossiella sp. CA-258035]
MENRWMIELRFEEDGTRTMATATVTGSGAPEVRGHGYARRNPADAPDSCVGEEIAAARALSNLSHELVDAAAQRIEEQTHRPARLHV